METARRDLLIAGALALAAPAALRAQPIGDPVVVIGAGLAGLGAARAIADTGQPVIVIEARSRIGGRVWTSRLWPDMPVDLGASWIHGRKGNPLTALASDASAPVLATSYDRSLTLPNQDEAATRLPEAERLIATARRRAEKLGRDQSLKSAITASPGWRDADDNLRRAVRHQVNATVEQEYGSDWAEASAWNIDDHRDFGGPDVLFPQGFDALPAHLAQGLTIRAGTAVTRLSLTAGGVRVDLADGGGLNASRVIVTVPLAALQRGQIAFSHPLARKRQAAIDSLRMGVLNKWWLRFDRIAWPDDVDWIEWIGPRPGSFAQWLSLGRAAGLPLLLGFHAGAEARGAEAMDDRASAAAAHDALKAMFGSDFPAPVAVQVTRWSQDALTGGSYSFNATGTGRKTRQALAGADWEGRLVFAGEATDPDWFGTAHGALISGRAAARLGRADR